MIYYKSGFTGQWGKNGQISAAKTFGYPNKNIKPDNLKMKWWKQYFLVENMGKHLYNPRVGKDFLRHKKHNL